MIGSGVDERRPQLETLMRKRENSRQKSRFVLSADKPPTTHHLRVGNTVE